MKLRCPVCHASNSLEAFTADDAEVNPIQRLQSIAKSALDKLPERWNMGFQAGLKQAIPYENEMLAALKEEREARKNDNAVFTDEILRLEEQVADLQRRLGGLL